MKNNIRQYIELAAQAKEPAATLAVCLLLVEALEEQDHLIRELHKAFVMRGALEGK